MSLFDFSSFLPRRLDSQNPKQSIGNFGCLPVWVKKRRNRKDSRCKNYQKNCMLTLNHSHTRKTIGRQNLQRKFFRFLLFFTQAGRQAKLPILCLRFWLSSRLGKKEEESKRLTLYRGVQRIVVRV